MNNIVATLALALMLALHLPAAEAGGYRYSGRQYGHFPGKNLSHRYTPPRHKYRRASPPRHHHNNGYHQGLGYAVGGAVAGGILTSILADRHAAPAPHYGRTGVNPRATVFIREANGLCYLRSHNYQGQVVLSPAPSSNCQ
ncbi:MAG: hypothetical protein RQ715_01145 [Methylococcales bacterium]|nr:hypothetical protein [Methylococcales bacterium]